MTIAPPHSNKTVLYISEYPIYEQQGKPTSDYASVRYRLIIPATELSKRGHSIQVLPPPPPSFNPQELNNAHVDTIVFGKTYTSQSELLAREMAKRGTRVVLDICDDLFNDQIYRTHLLNMCAMANYLVANTESMAQLIHHKTGKRSVVISDPTEGPKGHPIADFNHEPVKLLWFGHTSNFDTLAASLEEIIRADLDRQFNLTIVTKPLPLLLNAIHEHNNLHSSVLSINLLAWSTENTWKALHDTDLVIIPSLDRIDKSVKSPNRLVESIWAGRFTIAHPLPSYLAYRDYCWLGEKLSSGIQFALSHPNDIRSMIHAGQDFISDKHSVKAISDQWEAVFFN